MNVFTLITTRIIWAVILLPVIVYSQGTAPLGVLPMQFNSSFAGSNGGPRVSAFAGYGRGSYFKSNSYELYTSYDQFIPAIRSGIGITAGTNVHNMPSRFNFPASKPRYTTLSLAIAPKFSIAGKYTISPSIDFRYSHGWNLLYTTYADSVFTSWTNSYHSFGTRAGLLFNTSRFYIGYTVDLLSKAYFSDTTRTLSWGIHKQLSSYLQTGYTFGRTTSRLSFTPQLVFQIYDVPFNNRLRFELEAFNFNFKYKEFIWGYNHVGTQFGTTYTGVDRLKKIKYGSIHVGWQNEKFRIVLSNSLGILGKKEDPNTFYLASLSFRYLIPSAMQRKYTLPGTSY